MIPWHTPKGDYADPIRDILAEFSPPEIKRLAEAIFEAALSRLSVDGRFNEFVHQQQLACVVELLRELLRTYKDGNNIAIWEPPIETILQMYDLGYY
jgi:hypothetical protein